MDCSYLVHAIWCVNVLMFVNFRVKLMGFSGRMVIYREYVFVMQRLVCVGALALFFFFWIFTFVELRLITINTINQFSLIAEDFFFENFCWFTDWLESFAGFCFLFSFHVICTIGIEFSTIFSSSLFFSPFFFFFLFCHNIHYTQFVLVFLFDRS